jgi:rare lipoprotein A (peptidoglycan hydrolase)
MKILKLLLLSLALSLTISTAPSNAKSSLVTTINAKLAKWVHPTHKCAVGKEVMVTMYGNGDGFVGKPLACGGVLKQHEEPGSGTIAHRGLPCGTHLEITNPHNGRRTTAVVRDRGPYTIATLDLGPTVTRELGLGTSKYVCVAGL